MTYGGFFFPWGLGPLFSWPIGVLAGGGPRPIVDGFAVTPFGWVI